MPLHFYPHLHADQVVQQTLQIHRLGYTIKHCGGAHNSQLLLI